MILKYLCPPAIIYLIFSITQIILDIFNNDFNLAVVKFTVMITYTLLLNMLCMNGLNIVSWMIVSIPFITMSIVSTLILYVFGTSDKKTFYNN